MSDDPVLDRILAVALADPRVRAVVLSGSRADPAAPADRWRDDDVVFVPPPPPEGAPHHVPEPPSEATFADVCNEFWWVAPHVAKGLARAETSYAHHHLDVVLRDQLLTVLGWQVSAASGFRRGPGKHGRDLRRMLSRETWARFEVTYAGADPDATWTALEAMTDLFRDVAADVAQRFGLTYPWRDDVRVTAHLRRVRAAGDGAGG